MFTVKRAVAQEKSFMKGLSVLLLVLSGAVMAADCSNPNITSSTDESIEFTINQDGTVTDNTTKLQWMRCALGQTWNQEQLLCSGITTAYSWVDGLNAVKNFNAGAGFAGNKDWRMPNIAELRSIVEDCNSEPSINIALFPNTPALKFWSASTYAGLASNAWLVDFDQGRDNFELKSNRNVLRLVRIAD